ncbi:MAG: DnaA regulatory inactivator Hda, partial [Rhodanobacteraceae bacterium]
MPLSLRWPSHQRLDTFMAGANAHAIEAVRALAERGGESWLYLHGPRGSGKTHLLIGACRLALASGRNVRYLPLAALEDSRAEAIASFAAERGEVLSVDDVQVIAGDAHAERALFDLYNRAREARAILLFAASAPPNQIDLQLPDLVSRLSACTQHALQSLDEAGRREVLRMRAQQRGLQIDDAVLDWLF